MKFPPAKKLLQVIRWLFAAYFFTSTNKLAACYMKRKSGCLFRAGLPGLLEKKADPNQRARLQTYMKQAVASLENFFYEVGNVVRIQKELEEGNEELVSLPAMLQNINYSLSSKLG